MATGSGHLLSAVTLWCMLLRRAAAFCSGPIMSSVCLSSTRSFVTGKCYDSNGLAMLQHSLHCIEHGALLRLSGWYLFAQLGQTSTW